jgi:hypothetical protein
MPVRLTSADPPEWPKDLPPIRKSFPVPADLPANSKGPNSRRKPPAPRQLSRGDRSDAPALPWPERRRLYLRRKAELRRAGGESA